MIPGETAPPTDAESSGEDRTPTYPYSSWQGFRGLVDQLGSDGLPQVFDRSFFGDKSGSLVAQTRGTLRFLDLIDDERRPTDGLRALVAADEPGRIAVLRELAEKKYAAVIALGSDATQGQLADTFRAGGLSGESVTKAINFYVGLSRYVGLPVSPFFKKGPTRAAANGTGVTRRTGNRRKKTASASEEPAASTPESAPPPMAVQRSNYVDLLMRLAEQSADKGELQQDLLNRLELALGYKGPAGENHSPPREEEG